MPGVEVMFGGGDEVKPGKLWGGGGGMPLGSSANQSRWDRVKGSEYIYGRTVTER